MSATDSKDGDGAAASNTSSTDTQQIKGFQSLPWVDFPDVERAEWLNKMIRQMWPHMTTSFKKLLKETVEPKMNGSVLKTTFENIDLGNTPPRICGVKAYAENICRDEVIMDLKIIYNGDAEVEVAMTALDVPAGIKNIKVRGTLRVIYFPLIGGLNVFFLDKPSIKFELTKTANIPGASGIVDSVIQDLIANYCVMPNKIPIQLVNSIDITALKFPMPKGVLRLNVVAARELLEADTLFGKSSDPYCKLYVANTDFQTDTINKNINPVWNKYFEVAVDQMHGQVIKLEVWDADYTFDDELGTATIGIEKIANHGSMDSWLPLENVTTGEIHIRAFWFNLSKDIDDLNRDDLRPSSDEKLSTALLMVNVESAENLPRDEEKHEPSPYVNIEVGGDQKKSGVTEKTTDPRWESGFQFLVHNPREQELNVVVVDSDNDDRKLGHINYPIKNLLTAKDLTVQKPFQLSDSSANATVTLKLSLRIMTSKTPENPAVEEK